MRLGICAANREQRGRRAYEVADRADAINANPLSMKWPTPRPQTQSQRSNESVAEVSQERGATNRRPHHEDGTFRSRSHADERESLETVALTEVAKMLSAIPSSAGTRRLSDRIASDSRTI